MTDKRLLCAASFVRQGAVVADIGTDHAHLPVMLVQTGVCPKAIAADIGEGPAAAARRTVDAAGLSDMIEVRVGDGLSVLHEEEVDDIVIAGMGGETIIHILEETPWLKKKNNRRLILQPMTKTVELRTWLDTNGFCMGAEHLVQDGRHLYCVMVASFDGSPISEDALFPYVGALSFEEGLPYFEQQVTHLRRRATGLQERDEQQAKTFHTLAEQLRSFIEKGRETL